MQEKSKTQHTRSSWRDALLIEFVFSLPSYVLARLRILWVYSWAVVDLFIYIISAWKQKFVSRFFWGRGGLYRTVFHVIVSVLTVGILMAGLWNRVLAEQATESELNVAYGVVGKNDMLQQGSNLTTVVAIDNTQVNYQVYTHVVAKGESLDDIAKKYGVSKDTIKWANDRLLSPFNDNVNVGWKLNIPPMNGVLHTVEKGETLDKVVASIQNSNRFDIIELNDLVPPNYNLEAGTKLFVPNGKIPPPPPPPPTPTYVRNPGGGGYVSSGVSAQAALGSLPKGTFDDPLPTASALVI